MAAAAIESFRVRARARASGLAPIEGDDAIDALRAEVTAWFDLLPEPPVYRRSDEALKVAAAQRLLEAELLLARVEHPALGDLLAAYGEAVAAHVVVLHPLADGRVEAASLEWNDAVDAVRAALQSRRIFRRSDEEGRPVYDKATGASRFDPRPEPSMQARLMCPHPGCRKVAEYAFSPRVATHQLECASCKRLFKVHLAEVREVTVEQVTRSTRRYHLRIEELAGGAARVEFDDASGGSLSLARRDLVALLYSQWNELFGVLNLSSGWVLWVAPAGGCFLATAVYGAGAPQLAEFRAYRDQVLLQRRLGRAAVHAYYRLGPHLAARVPSAGPVHLFLRALLELVRGQLGRQAWGSSTVGGQR